MRTFLFAAMAASASCYSPTAAPVSKLSMSRIRSAPVMAAEPSPKAVAIGAACVGGLLGIQLTGEISTGIVFATALAYGTTMSNSFGDISKTTGSAGAKVYSKTLELNEEYDLLPKAKSALDTTVTIAGNIDATYGITDKLGLPAAIDKAEKTVEEVKSKVTAKVEELKKLSATN